MKITFVAWTRFDHRSQLLAQNLGASMHFLYSGQKGKSVWSLWRYVLQGRLMWRILNAERPDIIFIQNPPIFCVLVAFIYCRLHAARYVIDSHTAAFLSPKWRWSVGLHRALSGQALLTIVHNESQEELVKSWAVPYYVLADPLRGYPEGTSMPLDGKFNIAVISTFCEDEPLDVIFEAGKMLVDVNLYVTGDAERMPPHLRSLKPENCWTTGFLPYDQYVGLLKGVDAILDLTTRDHTLLCGAYEAVSLGKPLITSDWKILRERFPMGTIHVPNTVDGVCEGVRQAQRDLARYQREIAELRERLLEEWDEKFSELNRMLLSSAGM